MSERLGSFLKPRQEILLRRIGRRGDQWKWLLEEASGDEETAKLLAEIRGLEEFGGIPLNGRPKLEGPSLRVAAQKHAARRP